MIVERKNKRLEKPLMMKQSQLTFDIRREWTDDFHNLKRVHRNHVEIRVPSQVTEIVGVILPIL